MKKNKRVRNWVQRQRNRLISDLFAAKADAELAKLRDENHQLRTAIEFGRDSFTVAAMVAGAGQ